MVISRSLTRSISLQILQKSGSPSKSSRIVVTICQASFSSSFGASCTVAPLPTVRRYSDRFMPHFRAFRSSIIFSVGKTLTLISCVRVRIVMLLSQNYVLLCGETGVTGAVSFRSAGNAGFGRRRLYKSHARYPYGSRGGVQPRSQMSNGTSSSGVMSLNPSSPFGSFGDGNDGCDAVSGSGRVMSRPAANDARNSLFLLPSGSSGSS